MLGKLGEIPCEPMKEEQGEVAFGESIMDRQLHVLNETFIETKWLLFIQLMQSIKDDDYSNWIKCADVNKNARMQQKIGEIVKPKVHLYHVQVDDELIIEGDKWDQIFFIKVI